MANHKSAAKRARQTVKRQERNLSAKKTVRTWEKKLRVAISEKNGDSARELLKSYVSQVSRAARKGIVHTSTAARKVSRLSKQIHTLD